MTPLTLADFDPIPLATKGDAAEQATYAALGLASSSWENMISELALVFAALMRGDKMTAIKVFGKVDAPWRQVDMVRTASEFSLLPCNPPLHGRVLELCKVINKAAERRNEIGHAHVADLRIRSKTRLGYVALPSIETRRFDVSKMTTTFRFNSEQMRELALKFLRLRDEIFDLAPEVEAAMKASSEKPPQPAPAPKPGPKSP